IKRYSESSLQENKKEIFDYYIKDRIFIPIDRDRTPRDLNDGLNKNETNIPAIKASFNLMDEENLKNNKKMVNGVLKKTDIHSSLAYLINRFSDKPVILKKPDNEIIYDQIILPPNNIIRSI